MVSAMKLRHAAGFLLDGWYLMVAPSKEGNIDFSAPLTQWKLSNSYDSAASCDRHKKREIAHQCREGGGFFCELMKHAECVTSDDPRLKGN